MDFPLVATCNPEVAALFYLRHISGFIAMKKRGLTLEFESDGMHCSGVIFNDFKSKIRCRCSLNREKQDSMRKGSGLYGGILKGFIPHVIDYGHVGLIRYITAGSADHRAGGGADRGAFPRIFTDPASSDDADGSAHNSAGSRAKKTLLRPFLEKITGLRIFGSSFICNPGAQNRPEIAGLVFEKGLVANDFKFMGPLVVKNDLDRQHAGSKNIKAECLFGFIGIDVYPGGNLCTADIDGVAIGSLKDNGLAS
jgi:hypothetical protein